MKGQCWSAGFAVALVTLAAPNALAQASDESRIRSREPEAPESRRRTSPARPLQTDLDDINLADAGVLQLEPTSLMPEGTFIVRRSGVLIRATTGEWVAVLLDEGEADGVRGLILLPCETLGRMVSLVGSRGPATTFAITGQVFLYRGANYLLPTAYALELGQANPQQPAEGATEDLLQPTTPSTDEEPAGFDPSVESLLERLASEPPRSLVGQSAAPAPEGDVQDAPRWELLREDTMIVRRQGRLVRIGGGQWAFSIDNDTTGQTSVDRPLQVLPCAALAMMEGLFGSEGEGESFQLSGRVTRYANRNYILPTLMRKLPPRDLRSMR